MVKWSIPGAFLSLTKDTYIFNTDTYVTYTCYIFMPFIYKNTRYDLLIMLDLLYFFQWFTCCQGMSAFSAPLGPVGFVSPERAVELRQNPSLGYRRQVKRLALPIAMLETNAFFRRKKRYKLYFKHFGLQTEECGEAIHQPIFQICCE